MIVSDISGMVQVDPKQTSRVEKAPSRHMLLEINRVAEELDIIHGVLKQQLGFLLEFCGILDPAHFDNPPTNRQARFPNEKYTIKRILKDVRERISDCVELQKRADFLAEQNIRLVESYQDDSNNLIMIFTIVTVTCLPLSTVAGIFGMNLKGIVDSKSTVRHFWSIAAPITGFVIVASLLLTYWSTLKYLGRRFNRWLSRR
jgi:Mg2+ and Co2+ transporter CorA